MDVKGTHIDTPTSARSVAQIVAQVVAQIVAQIVAQMCNVSSKCGPSELQLITAKTKIYSGNKSAALRGTDLNFSGINSGIKSGNNSAALRGTDLNFSGSTSRNRPKLFGQQFGQMNTNILPKLIARRSTKCVGTSVNSAGLASGSSGNQAR